VYSLAGKAGSEFVLRAARNVYLARPIYHRPLIEDANQLAIGITRPANSDAPLRAKCRLIIPCLSYAYTIDRRKSLQTHLLGSADVYVSNWVG
jgi:hypothetical protein